MNSHKKEYDLNQIPDNTTYKVLFYVEVNNKSMLYETLYLNSPPELPSKGDYVSFDFIVDDSENEVFRQDGYISESDIGTDNKYTELYSGELKIKSIKTNYNKQVTKENKNTTIITKTVLLQKP